ncbi:MAG: hypothetical protein L0I62_07155 [Gammaproteobacteria bacterium]|nr:hypothetical protein [Gammaproteobacteria bacterium]
MPNTSNPLNEWLQGFREDPAVFPHQLDPINRRLLLVKLTETKIREAGFLDQRVLDGSEAGAWLALADALGAAPANPGPAGVILHCGHCGSTLISRLLGELPGAWVLREPLTLHALAAEARSRHGFAARLNDEEFSASWKLVQAALGRLPAGSTHAIVKHTSLTANLGPLLLEQAALPNVLCLWIPLEDYLATMLRQAQLREGVRLAAGEWIKDIAATLGEDCPRLADLGDAELAALNWTAAQLAFARTRDADKARVRSWQFGDFLADPETRLGEIALHFGLKVDSPALSRAMSSHWLRRYAKDPRFPFDAAARKQELASARKRFAAEIRTGMRFSGKLRSALALDPVHTA